MGAGTIITMVSVSILSGITQGVLGAFGKQQECQYVQIVTICVLAGTAVLPAAIKFLDQLKVLAR